MCGAGAVKSHDSHNEVAVIVQYSGKCMDKADDEYTVTVHCDGCPGVVHCVNKFCEVT